MVFGVAMVGVGIGIGAAIWSGGSSTSSLSTTTSQPPTSSTVPAATVKVTPPQGPAGAAFTLAATRFKPGENIRFEISSAQGKPFTGPPHKAGVDGTVTATYQATQTDMPGPYTVKATGDQGTVAQGQFTITGGTGQSSTTSTPKP